MAQDSIPAPIASDLLPPILACLPIAFLSPRPPPALLPLLTPILRQRVSLLSNNSNKADSWLTLLSWDREAASKLPDAVENIQIEPHPVSGEVEIQDPAATEYRRLDNETIHARFQLPEFNLLAMYLWCMGDQEKAWKLSELRTLEDLQDGSEWYDSIAEADEALKSRAAAPTQNTLPVSKTKTPLYEDDDSAYWAGYDATPEHGRTPMKRSPAPTAAPNRAGSTSAQGPSASELEYFARYMSEVQPALDPEDPDEPALPATESTLNGKALDLAATTINRAGSTDAALDRFFAHREVEHRDPEDQNPALISPFAQSNYTFGGDNQTTTLHHPRPASSSSTDSVTRLERKASIAVQAETGIKQHISTDIKSLFRLARSAGIDRSEFERIVKTELDVLAMMDME